jgi:acyl-CoA synthetase (AMP-forming)/AMP-acid ligase II
MMHQNHPTFFICLLAISKIGAIPSLINTNLSDDSLLHCIKIADTKLFLFDPLYENQVSTITQSCKELNVKLVAYGEATYESDLSALSIATALNNYILSSFSDNDTSEKPLLNVESADACYLIYTR